MSINHFNDNMLQNIKIFKHMPSDPCVPVFSTTNMKVI